MILEPNCENYEITTIGTSSEYHLQWKNLFHKNPLYFRIFGDFEFDNEIHFSSFGNKTTNFYEKTPVCIGFQ